MTGTHPVTRRNMSILVGGEARCASDGQEAEMRIRMYPAVLLPCVAVTLLILAVAEALAEAPANRDAEPLSSPSYVLIGWNDLGMHCSNKRFEDLAVLPPFNTFWALLLQRGDLTHPPQLVGAPFTVSYQVEGNTYSVGKTDFWSWEDRLFGVQLPDNVGLAGKGLSGSMDWSTNHFQAVGVPITPYDDNDLLHEQPYQLTRLKAYDNLGGLVATTEIVTPVSNEMMCSDCHVPSAGQTVEQAILALHDNENGTHLASSRPVLCAGCHGSNALGLPGNPGLGSLSLVMHQHHAEVTNNCYKCHPGPNTQCLRDVMSQRHSLTCQNCHGGMSVVASSIEAGRQPWLQEPRCETCHGAAYAESPNTLYRNSHNGHGGLYCESCHNSTHAIVPSREERDNRQNTVLQGFAGTLQRCYVCHGYVPTGAGPHGMYATGFDEMPIADMQPKLGVFPNPFTSRTEIRYRVVDGSTLELAVYDVSGKRVRVLTSRAQSPGDHTLVWDGTDADGRRVPAGVYFCRLRSGDRSFTARVILAKS
jgi:FlgD Ig-like domain/Cytochrome c554 and c-prime